MGEFPRVPWERFIASLPWAQGEHILIAAPTNAGKSTLMEKLIEVRLRRGGHVVVFVSKPYDDLFDGGGFKGWRRVDSWDKVKTTDRKVLLWPKSDKHDLRGTIAIHRKVFGDALNAIAQSRGWCVVIDELHWTASNEFCGLAPEIAILHHQGRSSKISMVSLTQRPAWIPNIIYSSVTHAFIARTRDKNDLKRLADLGGVDARTAMHEVTSLETRYDYVAFHAQGDNPPVVVNTRR